MNWIVRLFKKETLLPIYFLRPDCVELNVGDVLISELQNSARNLIDGAEIMKGKKVKWKVTYVAEHGSVMIENKESKIFLNHLKWKNGNTTVIGSSFYMTEMQVKWYKQVYK